jgi:hypothetical protein
MEQDVKIVVVRHPDAATQVSVWIDGVRTDDPEHVYVVDPGAGHELTSWRGALADVVARDDVPADLVRSLRETYAQYETSSWVEDNVEDPQQAAEVYCGRFHDGQWCSWSTSAPDVDAAASQLREHWANTTRQV